MCFDHKLPLMDLRLILIGSIGVFLSGVAFLFRADSLDAPQALLSLAIIWIGLGPGIQYIFKPRELRTPIPFLELTGCFYAIFFGVPSLLSFSLRGGRGDSDTRIFFYQSAGIEAVSIEALLLVLSGLVLLYFTWYGSRRFRPKVTVRVFRNFHESDDKIAIELAAWILALGSLAYSTLPDVRLLSSIGQFLQPAGFVAFALFYLMKVKGQITRLSLFGYFFAVFPIWLGSFIAAGFSTPLILILITWVVLRFSVTNVLPWKSISLGILLFVLIYPHLANFRQQIWVLEPQASLSEKVHSFVASFLPNALNPWQEQTHGFVSNTGLIRRVSLILPFSYVIQNTPSPVPYWNGITYEILPVAWIPRLIWSTKPEERWGNKFGQRYKILEEGDTSTSINIPWITELFVNFGQNGVIFGMALIGMLMGFLDRIFNGYETNTIERSIAVGLILPLFYQESNFSLMTGSLLLQVLSILAYFYILIFFTRLARAKWNTRQSALND